MQSLNHRTERGDTIIEVIFAIAIFSFVAISSFSIMNKGVATGERALEVTLVRQQINAQAEALRFIHEAKVVQAGSPYAATWNSLVAKQETPQLQKVYGQEKASDFGTDNNRCIVPTGSEAKPFIVNARKAEVWTGTPVIAATVAAGTNPPAYPQVMYQTDGSAGVKEAYGIWVESVPSDIVYKRRFVDFHIRACWPAPGSSVPMTIGTIVRLYDPI